MKRRRASEASKAHALQCRCCVARGDARTDAEDGICAPVFHSASSARCAAFAMKTGLGSLERVTPQLREEPFVAQCRVQALRDRIRIRRIEQGVGPVDHFGNARRIRGDDRGAARHRFEHRKAEAFVQRWKDEKRAAVVEQNEVGIVHAPGENESFRRQAIAFGQSCELPALKVLDGTREHEPVSVTKLRRKRRKAVTSARTFLRSSYPPAYRTNGPMMP